MDFLHLKFCIIKLENKIEDDINKTANQSENLYYKHKIQRFIPSSDKFKKLLAKF